MIMKKMEENNRERKRAGKELAEVDCAHVDEPAREATLICTRIIVEQNYPSFWKNANWLKRK